MSNHFYLGSLIVILAFAISTEGCSQTKDYKARSLTSLAGETSHIILGNVTVVYPGLQDDIAQVDIFCVLKGGHPFPKVVNVTDSRVSCLHNDLQKAQQYIMFISVSSDANGAETYLTDGINSQSSAYEPTEDNFQAIARSGIPGNATCHDSGTRIPCFTVDIEDEECSGGMATKYGVGGCFMWMIFILVTVTLNM